MKLRSTIVGLAILASAVDGGALTLGRARGAAIVGRALDVSIPVQLTADESAAQLCAEADVFHADTKQESARVRVTVDTAQPLAPVIRVVSSTPIDEPVVTVYVKVGCGQKNTRRYVLLADVASEPAPASLPAPAAVSLPTVSTTPVAPPATVQAVVVAPPVATLPVLVPPVPAGAAPAAVPETSPEVVTSVPGAASGTVPAQAAAKPVPVAKPAVAKPKSQAPKKPVAKQVPAKPKATVSGSTPVEAKAVEAAKGAPKPTAKEAAADKTKAGKDAGQSRLKLDPMTTLADRVANLENATAIPTPEQVKEAQRVQTLEESVKTLVALAAKNEASMLQMRTQLAKAESERISINWIYALGGLLLACLAAITWLWRRQRSAPVQAGARDDWWSGGNKPEHAVRQSQAGVLAGASAQGPESVPPMAAYRAGPSAPPSVFDEVHQARTSQFGANALKPAGSDATVAVKRSAPASDSDDVDVSLVEMSESNFDNLMQSGQAHSALRKGPLPRQAEASATRAQPMELSRAINSDQVFDIRQQADFFVSLGQTDQAVRILEARLNESGESSPLLYLDLLQILHSLGLRQDYHQFREEFNILFNSHVPEFAAFKEEGRSLEEYPHVLAHVTALWNTPKAQMVIEASVFRDPTDDKSKPFDLAAFRDLLLLHAIAQNTSRAGPVNSNLSPLPSSATATAGAAAAPARQGGADVDIALDTRNGMLPMPPIGGAVDLDLDLSDLVNPAAPQGSGAMKPVPLMASNAVPAPVVPVLPALLPVLPSLGAATASAQPAQAKAVSDIDLPDLSPNETSTVLPLGEVELPSLVDNNFLDFKTDATVKYTLPKPKA